MPTPRSSAAPTAGGQSRAGVTHDSFPRPSAGVLPLASTWLENQGASDTDNRRRDGRKPRPAQAHKGNPMIARAFRKASLSIVGLGSLVLADAAFAQSCTLRHQLIVANQQRACITDFPLAQQPVPGTAGTVATFVPRSGVYSIAVSEPNEACIETLTMEWAQWPKFTAQMNGDVSSVRSEAVRRSCEKRAARNDGSSCTCVVVIEDAVSSLTAEQLSSRFAKPKAASN